MRALLDAAQINGSMALGEGPSLRGRRGNVQLREIRRDLTVLAALLRRRAAPVAAWSDFALDGGPVPVRGRSIVHGRGAMGVILRRRRAPALPGLGSLAG